MKRKIYCIIQALTFFALNVLNLCATCWAGPPGPPTVSPPATPVGGIEITIATAVAIAGYGYWKYRK
jgi:hypothetical protein